MNIDMITFPIFVGWRDATKKETSFHLHLLPFLKIKKESVPPSLGIIVNFLRFKVKSLRKVTTIFV